MMESREINPRNGLTLHVCLTYGLPCHRTSPANWANPASGFSHISTHRLSLQHGLTLAAQGFYFQDRVSTSRTVSLLPGRATGEFLPAFTERPATQGAPLVGYPPTFASFPTCPVATFA
jgi:hypothetical protein